MKANKCLVMKFRVGDDYDPEETERHIREAFGGELASGEGPRDDKDGSFSWFLDLSDGRLITHVLYDNDKSRSAVFVLRQRLPDNETYDPDLLDSLLGKDAMTIQSALPETAYLRYVEHSYTRTWDKGIEKSAKDVPADLMPEEYSRDTSYATHEKPYGKIMPSYSECVMKTFTEHRASVLALMTEGTQARPDLSILIRDADLLCKDLMALNDDGIDE